MNTITNVFIKPRSVFIYLFDKFDHTLNRRINLLFIFSGLVLGTRSFLREMATGEVDLGLQIIMLFLSGFVSLALGKYLIAPIIYGIGKLLKGKAELIDIRVVLAYAEIPLILTLPIILYLGFDGRYAKLDGTALLIVNIINVMVWLASLNILIQGLIQYNSYSLWKALLNLAPFWLIGSAVLIYYAIAFL